MLYILLSIQENHAYCTSVFHTPRSNLLKDCYWIDVARNGTSTTENSIQLKNRCALVEVWLQEEMGVKCLNQILQTKGASIVTYLQNNTWLLPG